MGIMGEMGIMCLVGPSERVKKVKREKAEDNIQYPTLNTQYPREEREKGKGKT
jgi:hypothetical protein